jgi:hypothetical protein
MNVTSYLNQAFKAAIDIFPTKEIYLNDGSFFKVIWNGARFMDERQSGGYEVGNTVSVIAQSEEIPIDNPRELLGQKVTIEGKTWRVEEVSQGDSAVTFILTYEFKG